MLTKNLDLASINSQIRLWQPTNATPAAGQKMIP